MAEYICKCGRVINKNSKSATTGNILENYGVEGKTWEYVNGVPTFTEYALTNPDYPGGDPNLLLKVQFGAKLTYLDIDCSINLALTPEALALRKKYMDDPLLDRGLVSPPYKLSTDESTEASRIMGDIKTYSDEMTLKFITGEVPMSEWENYVATIESLGIGQVLEIHQTAYDRYVS